MTSPDEPDSETAGAAAPPGSGHPDSAGQAPAAPSAEPARSSEPAPSPRAPGEPAESAPASLLPEQSPEDTDSAWGEYPDRSDDYLLRDRPPHWNDY